MFGQCVDCLQLFFWTQEKRTCYPCEQKKILAQLKDKHGEDLECWECDCTFSHPTEIKAHSDCLNILCIDCFDEYGGTECACCGYLIKLPFDIYVGEPTAKDQALAGKNLCSDCYDDYGVEPFAFCEICHEPLDEDTAFFNDDDEEGWYCCSHKSTVISCCMCNDKINDYSSYTHYSVTGKLCYDCFSTTSTKSKIFYKQSEKSAHTNPTLPHSPLQLHLIYPLFYLSQSIINGTRLFISGEPYSPFNHRAAHLYQTAVTIRFDLLYWLPEKLITYLAQACAGELRHCERQGCSNESVKLCYKWGITPGEGRASAQISCLKNQKLWKKFFIDAEEIFLDFDSDGFGGESWANIARTAGAYTNNKITDEVFIDCVASLRHNGGVMFDKR